MLSNLVDRRFALLLAKLPGKHLSDELFLEMGIEQRRLLKKSIWEGFTALRSLGMVHEDAHRRNVIWDQEHSKAYIIDFEMWSTKDVHICLEKI